MNGYARDVRFVTLVLAMTIACKQSKTADSADRSPGSAMPATPSISDRSELAMDHVPLLQPDAVIEKRLADQSGWAAAIKAATDAVIAYDKSHPDALPSELDLVIVARPTAMRCWLVGAKGDVVVSELELAFTKLPRFGVREGNVGVVVTIVRTGSKPAARGPESPYLPAAWKGAAGKQGSSEIDDVIDASWPR
jgi:hypothetical protein